MREITVVLCWDVAGDAGTQPRAVASGPGAVHGSVAIVIPPDHLAHRIPLIEKGDRWGASISGSVTQQGRRGPIEAVARCGGRSLNSRLRRTRCPKARCPKDDGERRRPKRAIDGV